MSSLYYKYSIIDSRTFYTEPIMLYGTVSTDCNPFVMEIDEIDKLILCDIIGEETSADYMNYPYDRITVHWPWAGKFVNLNIMKRTALRWFYLNDPFGWCFHEYIGYTLVPPDEYAESLL